MTCRRTPRGSRLAFIRGLANLRAEHHGNVLTIGNFDGMHLGHQAVMARLRALAADAGLPAMAMIFEPTPAEFFAAKAPPARLSSLREKVTELAARDVDRLLCLHFNSTLAHLSAEDFVRRLLVDRLGARVVLVGEDFRFGHGRVGDVDLLTRAGRQHGFIVAPLPTVMQDGLRVSSTRVRAALAAGKIDKANALLGRPYRMCGRVVAGARLGRTLGVPTANLRLRRKPAPRFGVYAARVRLQDGRWLDAAASLGTRPTVDGSGPLLEAYLLDFDGDLYGQAVTVCFHAFLRPEIRFDDTAMLRNAMQMDIARTRALLKSVGKSSAEP